jgi:subtilase-type serine protease
VPASAQNVSPATVNVLNLLSPFLTLNSTAIGQTTLTDNLEQAVAINQNESSVALLNNNLSTSALAALAISDENLLGSASNTVYGIPTSTTFGPAANLAGGLPAENTTSYGTLVNGSQTIGGFGSILGAAYVNDVSPSSVTLPNTVALLTTAFGFTGNSLATGDSQVAKFYFANGTWNGTAAAVAPSGYTLPTYGGLPNGTNSVYDTAYDVTNKQAGQNAYGDSHPYQTYSDVSSTYTLYDPTVKTAYSTTAYPNAVNPDKPSSNPSFPSSHMAYAMTDSVLLGMLVPQLYQSMLVRASAMGESRIVVGVHYPLDIIGSRAFVYYDLANYLSNPAYINNATMTGTAANLPSMMGSAQGEINSVLGAAATSAGCGSSLATCATSAMNVNPYAPSANNAAVYAARMTYGLPTIAGGAKELTDTQGQDASILLATVFGGSSQAAQTLLGDLGLKAGMDGNLSTATIQQVIANTESDPFAAFVGTELSYWSRINLYSAIGYFGGVTGTLTTADGDHLTTDVTVASGGVIDVTGKFTVGGAFDVEAGGALGVTLGGLTAETGYSQVVVGGTSVLAGALDVTLGNGFDPASGDTFDLVETAGGLTNDISALYLDGGLCSALGGESYLCSFDGRTDVISLLAIDPPGATDLELKVASTPEPSTWALMALGFAGLGFAGGRGARRSAAKVSV